jgi:AbrB family looped-hinge helix DNA binding protein
MALLERHQHPFTSSVTRKGQVTIPAHVRRLLGIAPHDKVAFLVEQGKVQIAPATSVVQRTAGLLASDQPALSPKAEREAAEEAIAAEAVARGGA